MADNSRQLGIFRNMLVYAGIRNTPKPLPPLQVDPVDEFWQTHVAQEFSKDSGVMLKDRIIDATTKLAEEIRWNYDSDVGDLTLNVNDRMSFGDLYGDWFVSVMQPHPVGAQV